MIPASQLQLWVGDPLETRVLRVLRLTSSSAFVNDVAWLFDVCPADVEAALMTLREQGLVQLTGTGSRAIR